MSILAYIRVSHVDSAEGVSLDAQRSKIEQYCALHNLEIKEVISDVAISAKNLARPGIQKVIASIKEKSISGIVVYKLDRLCRNTGDAIEIANLCQKYNVALHSIVEKIDTVSPIGQFFFTLISAIATLERQQIAERTAFALKYKRQNSEKTGGLIPYGYGVESGADGRMRLIPLADEQRVIDRIVELRDCGLSYRKIVSTLNSEGIPTKTKKGVWRPSGVMRILEYRTRFLAETDAVRSICDGEFDDFGDRSIEEKIYHIDDRYPIATAN